MTGLIGRAEAQVPSRSQNEMFGGQQKGLEVLRPWASSCRVTVRVWQGLGTRSGGLPASLSTGSAQGLPALAQC